jgi:hypothetical protein
VCTQHTKAQCLQLRHFLLLLLLILVAILLHSWLSS